MPQIILPDLEVSGVFPSPRRFTTWVAGRRTLIVLNQAIATYVTQWPTTSGTIANPSSWIAGAIGSVVAPLFNRGTNNANLKIAKSEYEIASLRFQQKLFDAGMEVNNALIVWQTAKDRVALDKKQIVALKGAVHNTRLLMRNTSTNYLEVLTAQQRLLEAELTEASDRYDAVQAIIALYHALGGGKE